MEIRRIRTLFRHAAPRRVHPAAMVSAAVLAVAATSGSLLTLTTAPSTAHTAANPAVVDMAFTTGNHRGDAEKKAAAPKPPSEKIGKYDFEYQPNFYYCGPAATRIALTSNGVTLSQDELAQQLGTTVNGTNSAEDITRVMNKVIGKDAYRTQSIPGPGATPAEMDRLQADVVNALSDGRAVVANIAGGATDNAGFWRSFPGGHYVTIVGYSDEGRQVQVADPSGVGPATYWMSTIDMASWMASRGYSA
ncbi:C39 family peptidase [Micromonospora sp. NPDC049679]|uniref:C39 family peptidase n=1 Tax=Micromonospora sp. NPDC049679 TaxID=3155920 RepID=UPI0033FA2AF6